MKTDYPTGTDLTTYATAAGITIPDAATAIAAGIQAFEKRVKRRMLVKSSTSDVTRKYDPPTNREGKLDLLYDLATLTEVRFLDQVMVADQEYWVRPTNYVMEGCPILWLEFWRRWTGPIGIVLRNSISVIGRWGYGLDALSEDAWLAMVFEGMMLQFPQVQFKRYGGLTEWSQANVMQRQDSKGGGGYLIGEWSSMHQAAVTRYRKLRL